MLDEFSVKTHQVITFPPTLNITFTETQGSKPQNSIPNSLIQGIELMIPDPDRFEC
jgi:hypothetical protein